MTKDDAFFINRKFFSWLTEAPKFGLDHQKIWVTLLASYGPKCLRPEFLKKYRDKLAALDTSFKGEGFEKIWAEGIRIITGSSLIPETDAGYVRDVVTYLNDRTGRKGHERFHVNNARTNAQIRARLMEGFKPEDLKRVIDNKAKAWIGTVCEIHLNPITLFKSEKFEIYLKETTHQTNATNGQARAAGSDSGRLAEIKSAIEKSQMDLPVG